jgi:hypothetical protein
MTLRVGLPRTFFAFFRATYPLSLRRSLSSTLPKMAEAGKDGSGAVASEMEEVTEGEFYFDFSAMHSEPLVRPLFSNLEKRFAIPPQQHQCNRFFWRSGQVLRVVLCAERTSCSPTRGHSFHIKTSTDCSVTVATKAFEVSVGRLCLILV